MTSPTNIQPQQTVTPNLIMFDPTTGLLPGIKGLPGGVSPFSGSLDTTFFSPRSGSSGSINAATNASPVVGSATPQLVSAELVQQKEAEENIEKIKALEEEVEKLKSENAKMADQLTHSRESEERLEKELGEVKAQKESAETERDMLWTHVALLQERVSTLVALQESLTAELEILRASHQNIKTNMSGFQKELAESMSNIMLKYIRNFNIAKVAQDAETISTRARELEGDAASSVQRIAASEDQLRRLSPANMLPKEEFNWEKAYEEMKQAANGADLLSSDIHFDDADTGANIVWSNPCSTPILGLTGSGNVGGGSGAGSAVPGAAAAAAVVGMAGSKEVGSATVAKALEVITSSSSLMDPALTNAFCITYRTFMSGKELITALATRYRGSESNPEARLIKEKTLSFLQKWIDMFPHDFEDKELRTLTMAFVCTVVNANNWTQTLTQLVSKEPPACTFTPMVAENAFNANESFNFLDFSAEEIARQLCLLDAHLFSYIRIEELLNPRNWNKESGDDCPFPAVNVLAFIQHWNRIINLVLTETMGREDYKERAKVLRHFINIGKECLKAKDFNAAIAIAFAIKSPSISRMHLTMDYLTKHNKKNEKQAYDELVKISDASENWKGTRTLMNEACPPAVPHIGIYLGDLVFLNDGNPDMVGSMVNFSKKRMVASIISKITGYQKSPYPYQFNRRVAHWLEYSPVLSMDVCFEMSKKLEPKAPGSY